MFVWYHYLYQSAAIKKKQKNIKKTIHGYPKRNLFYATRYVRGKIIIIIHLVNYYFIRFEKNEKCVIAKSEFNMLEFKANKIKEPKTNDSKCCSIFFRKDY